MATPSCFCCCFVIKWYCFFTSNNSAIYVGVSQTMSQIYRDSHLQSLSKINNIIKYMESYLKAKYYA